MRRASAERLTRGSEEAVEAHEGGDEQHEPDRRALRHPLGEIIGICGAEVERVGDHHQQRQATPAAAKTTWNATDSPIGARAWVSASMPA